MDCFGNIGRKLCCCALLRGAYCGAKGMEGVSMMKRAEEDGMECGMAERDIMDHNR